MNKDIIFMANLLNNVLINQAPVLSGNLKQSIRIKEIQDNEITIVIEPRFYNVAQYNKTGKINLYKAKQSIEKYGRLSYAEWLNDKGAFGTGNKSMHWTNRAIYDVCTAFARTLNAEVRNTLPLD